MEQEKTNKKLSCLDNVEEVVHKLIYPAILGSMIYGIIDDMIRSNNCLPWQNWFFKVGIVIFYLLDYTHLYTFMEKRLPKRKKSIVCIIIDTVVPVILMFAFNLKCQALLCIIPLLFAIYELIVITNKNKKPIFIMHIVFWLIIIGINFCLRDDVILTIAMVSYYITLMFVEQKYGTDDDVDEYIELSSNKGNIYLVDITEKMKI